VALDPVAQEALQGLTSAVESILPAPADPALKPALSLGSAKVAPLGLGGFVGTSREPDGQILGRRVRATMTVRVAAASADGVPAAVASASEALLAADPVGLRTLGILDLTLAGVAGPPGSGGGANSRDLSVELLYEYVKPPAAPEGVISTVPLELDVDTTGGTAIVVPERPFTAASLAAFEVVDDPAATHGGPSQWGFDATEERIEERSGMWGGSTTTNANKAGTALVLRTGPGVPAVQDLVLRAEVRSEDVRGIGVVFRWQDGDNFYFFLMDATGGFRRIGKKVAGTFADLDTPALDATQGYTTATSYRLRVEARGRALSAFLDDRLAVEGADASIAGPGRVGLLSWRNTKSFFYELALLEV
jgi:hypothetical protein